MSIGCRMFPFIYLSSLFSMCFACVCLFRCLAAGCVLVDRPCYHSAVLLYVVRRTVHMMYSCTVRYDDDVEYCSIQQQV